MTASDKNLLGGRLGWLAMGAFAAYAAMGSSDLAMAAVTKDGGVAALPPGAGAAVKQFNIQAGPLDEAIAAYEQASGVKVKLTLPNGTIGGFKSQGVVGSYASDEALRLLLDGTGLSFQLENNVAVVGVQAKDTVSVTSSLNTVALTQFTEPLTDTAQTVNVVPQFIMQEQAVTTLRDSLRNVPGISIAAGEGGNQGDNLTIRGFSARSDIYLDGIRDFGSYYRDAFDYDAIEVLQGPASVQFGRGSTGGVVNQESKTPRGKEFVNGTIQLGTNQMRRVSADVNEPLTNFVPNAAFRMNVVGSQNMVAQRNVAETRRFGIAPSLAFGLGKPTRATISYLHENEDSTPDYGLPYFGIKVAPVDRKNYYGYARQNYLRTNPDVVTGKVEHDFGSSLTLRSTLRWGNYPRDINVTEPVITSAPVLTAATTAAPVATATCSSTAATPCYSLNTSLSQIQVRQQLIPVKSVEDILWEQTSAVGHVKLGSLENNFVVMVEGGRERSRPQRLVYASVPMTSALNPNPELPLAVGATLGAKTWVSSQSYGVSFMDTLKPTWWLLFSGGLRFDYFNSQSNTAAIGTTAALAANRLDKKPTYRAAVVVKPRRNGSVYFDYGTSFNPSAESLSLTANNAALPPQTNETYEVGTKWDLVHDRLNINGAYFRTNKANVYETDPNNTLNVIPVGNQRVQGLQVGAIGHMPQHFDLIVGYAYLDGTVTNSIVNASPFAALYKANDPIYGQAPYFINPTGFPLANVPKNSGNVWVTHDLLWRFVGGFGGNYTGPRRASSTALVALPQTSAPTPIANVPIGFKAIEGYWVFSAMLRRPINDRLDFQANLINLANKFYIDAPHPNHLIPGEGFNAQFGLNLHF
ncbi:MAG: TonB-dependent receptor plug [Acidobacteriaceae bacterium]|nr:TonB-dependent receptor plug [Acidobacteriaceae bacterium]